MSDLPIYIGPEEGMRQPHPWDGLDEMLEIAEKLDHSSPFRRIPKKRRAGVSNSSEWPLDDGRILSIKNFDLYSSRLPSYELKLHRPGATMKDALAVVIAIHETAYMPLKSKTDGIKALRTITSNAQKALDAIHAQRLAPPQLLRDATAAMISSMPSARNSGAKTLQLSHRAPWQEPSDFLEDHPDIKYQGPPHGLALPSTLIESFLRKLTLRPYKMTIQNPAFVDPVSRMSSVQKAQELAAYGQSR